MQKVLATQMAAHCRGDGLKAHMARMGLAVLPRGGGDGDAIRLTILNVLRDNGIKEGHRPGIECPFLAQWHQKLHSNTTPVRCLPLPVSRGSQRVLFFVFSAPEAPLQHVSRADPLSLPRSPIPVPGCHFVLVQAAPRNPFQVQSKPYCWGERQHLQHAHIPPTPTQNRPDPDATYLSRLTPRPKLLNF